MKPTNTVLLAALVLAPVPLACGFFSTPVAMEPTTPPAFRPTLSLATDNPTEAPPQVQTTAPAQPARATYFAPGDPVALDEIHMLSLSDGWALSGPFVLATADGGQTWRQASPPVSLPDGTWFAENGSQVLETSNGGRTWEPAADPDSLHPWEQVKAHAAFLDARTAWVVYSTGSSFHSDTRVWRTADGGLSWVSSTLFDVQSDDARVHGDATWAHMFALDPENIWLRACAAWVGAGQHFDCQFFRSRDGGASWTPLDVDVGVDYTGMSFSDAAHGWLVWQTLGAYYNNPPEYATTVDGGLTWESHTFPPPPEAPDLFSEQYLYCEPYQLNLLSSQSVRLMVGCFDYGYQPKAFASYLYASEDGGRTWSVQRLPDPVYAPEYTLFYFDAGRALLLGREMYSSDDGGQTWTHFKTVYWDGQFSFADRENGWAVARADSEVALVGTRDGGATWSEVVPTIGE